MKKWAFVTIMLYALFLFVFSWPVGLLFGFNIEGVGIVADFYTAWWGWIAFAVFALDQAILLVFSDSRPVAVSGPNWQAET